MDRRSEEGIILLVVCGDLVFSTISSLHHQSLVGISTKERGVSGSEVEFADRVDVGLEAIGFVGRIADDGNTSGSHVE